MPMILKFWQSVVSRLTNACKCQMFIQFLPICLIAHFFHCYIQILWLHIMLNLLCFWDINKFTSFSSDGHSDESVKFADNRHGVMILRIFSLSCIAITFFFSMKFFNLFFSQQAINEQIYKQNIILSNYLNCNYYFLVNLYHTAFIEMFINTIRVITEAISSLVST